MQYTLHVHVRVRPRPSARLGTYKDIWSCAVRKGPPAASYSSLFAVSSPSYNGRRRWSGETLANVLLGKKRTRASRNIEAGRAGPSGRPAAGGRDERRTIEDFVFVL